MSVYTFFMYALKKYYTIVFPDPYWNNQNYETTLFKCVIIYRMETRAYVLAFFSGESFITFTSVLGSF